MKVEWNDKPARFLFEKFHHFPNLIQPIPMLLARTVDFRPLVSIKPEKQIFLLFFY